MEQKEKEILARIKRSDPKAFEELFRRYYPALLRYAITLLKDEDLAEDAVQSVFVHIWEKRIELEIKKTIKSYLFRSMYNASLNLLKQKELNEKSRKALSLIHPGIEQSFLLNIEARELETRIAAALETLPEKCRLVFDLSRNKGLKNREVAEKLSISIKTVEAHLSKALGVLKKKIG
ncbi:MAG: RNA polymerase sigma-70 factor [Bacteroidales bacterium]|nr:RNA polymerase sigma-70 factor [Bacteroidales bacterium]MCF8457993.1 RNA polymerase sigma-70 factor [Bacteroidales bacterium]